MVTELETRLIELGNALARSIGHNPAFRCPKMSPAVPCTCGSKDTQAKALDDWQHVMVEIGKTNG